MSKADDDLGKVRPVILGMPILPQAIFFVPLEVGAGGVEKDQVDLHVQKVRHGEVDFIVDDLPVSQKHIHRPVQVLKIDRLGIVKLFKNRFRLIIIYFLWVS